MYDCICGLISKHFVRNTMCFTGGLPAASHTCSWSLRARRAARPATPVTFPSSAPAAALTALPTSTCMTATHATRWTDTATTACARLTSSSASRSGVQVCCPGEGDGGGAALLYIIEKLYLQLFDVFRSLFLSSFRLSCRSESCSRHLLSEG